jgi:class 3 adenylate cyclase
MRRASTLRDTSTWLAAGFAGGVMAGALLWRRTQGSASAKLFAGSPVNRAAALAWLGRHPSVANARTVRDYIRWERSPALRRRGERVLARMLTALES